jgi:hypothetical protein
MGVRRRQSTMMAGVVVQRAGLLVFIECVIQLVRHGHGADPQQHGGQQPGGESSRVFRNRSHRRWLDCARTAPKNNGFKLQVSSFRKPGSYNLKPET